MASLHGVRTTFERELGLKNILIETDEMIKLRIAQRIKQNEVPQYPYSYLNLNELQAVKDLQPNKVVRRHGYRMGMLDATRGTSSKGYIFPVRASVDLKYVDSDPYRVIRVAEGMMILGQIGAMFFELLVGGDDGMRLEARVEIPESVTIPVADNSNPQSPGGMEVTLSFVLHTYAGFFRDVSSVNAVNPNIRTTIVQGLENAA